MAKALCELQFEIQNQIFGEDDDFTPKTPGRKELKRKFRMSKVSMRLDSKFAEAKADSELDVQSSLQIDESHAWKTMGSFPSPEELANLDESFLAKRCSLGYRASRILKLSQGIVQGDIQLMQLEEDCKETSLSNYNKLAEQLRQIDGFGPFTCANVLMCMGFYHVIPADSETIRHLKQGRAVALLRAKVREIK
ncbi:DNA glycosylase [Corchorus olitorius]|uniref:DNA glycosylase n=1 Tax=Corchorus olitorius TaxID=93759 RepID=A0A1R3K2P6_9ROSI|nr:DNA glycosylase [Corchorus olitorius]